MGPRKVETYGSEILAVVIRASETG
jgi:hypothetical protein